MNMLVHSPIVILMLNYYYTTCSSVLNFIKYNSSVFVMDGKPLLECSLASDKYMRRFGKICEFYQYIERFQYFRATLGNMVRNPGKNQELFEDSWNFYFMLSNFTVIEDDRTNWGSRALPSLACALSFSVKSAILFSVNDKTDIAFAYFLTYSKK